MQRWGVALWILQVLLTTSWAQIVSPSCILGIVPWTFNSKGQSPCEVAARLGATCENGSFMIAPLRSGFTYTGPAATHDTPCKCSTVYFSVLSGCALCQGRGAPKWKEFSLNCPSTSDRTFPQPIPQGITVPNWAYLDVKETDNVNTLVASTVGGVESASAPAPTNGTDTESHADSPKATPVGAIVGGVIGGFIFLALVLSAVFWIFKKKKRPRDTTIESEMVGVLPAQSTGAPSSVWGNMDGYSALSSPPPVADPMVFDAAQAYGGMTSPSSSTLEYDTRPLAALLSPTRPTALSPVRRGHHQQNSSLSSLPPGAQQPRPAASFPAVQ